MSSGYERYINKVIIIIIVKVFSEALMRPLPLIFAAFSEGFEEKFVFFCGGKEKSVNF